MEEHCAHTATGQATGIWKRALDTGFKREEPSHKQLDHDLQPFYYKNISHRALSGKPFGSRHN